MGTTSPGAARPGTTELTEEPGPGPGCERPGDGWLAEPVSAVTSLAFVVAALVVLVRGRAPRGRTGTGGYVLLVAGTGLGSFVQHGPDPAWSDVAVVLTAARARSVPEVRRRTAVAIGLLAVGGLVGTLSRAGGPLCDPDSLWQGHAAWHVLAATALAVLAPTLGAGAECGREVRR